jgi:soluble lytic murein transglycosylase-like protein
MSWVTDTLSDILTKILGTQNITYEGGQKVKDETVGGWFNSQPKPSAAEQYNSTPTPTPQQYQNRATPTMHQYAPGQVQGAATVTPTATPTPTPARPNSRGRIQQTNLMRVMEQVDSAIATASQKYGIPSELLYDIAFSESSLDPTKTNQQGSSATGLYQFTSPTWDTVMKYQGMPGSSLKLPNNDRLDPLTSALAAAYLIKFGQLGRWDESKWNWGQNYKPQEIESYYSQTLGGQNGNE